MSKYKLVLVTVTYRPDASELSDCLDSIYKYNDLEDQLKVVVVDNSPSSCSIINEFRERYTDVSFIAAPENKGFGYSNNLGFCSVESEFVLFFNNDTELVEPIFKNIIAFLESNEDIACVGIHQNGGQPSYFKKFNAPNSFQMDKFDDTCHFISGAFMFFRSSSFKDIGMFDTNIFMYFEEMDTSIRLGKLGLKTAFLPYLNFLHKAGNRRKLNEKSSCVEIDSYAYMCSKYGITPKFKHYGNRYVLLLFYNVVFMNLSQIRVCYNIIHYYIQTLSKLKANR